VRRELWENRALYVTPLTVAALVLLSSVVGSHGLPARLRAAAALDAAQQQARLSAPFGMGAGAIMMFTYVAAAFYCLDALYGERRDRSILFWKSLPVSDLTAVLAKIAIPVAVLPPLLFAIALATQTVMMALGSLVAAASGLGLTALWHHVPLAGMAGVMAYGLGVHALWHAPLYAWLLLLSAWARRMPILWAVLPPLAFGLFERMAFGTTHVGAYVRYRLAGTMKLAFDFKARGEVDLQPLRFLTTPGLWLGLIFAAACVVAAARLRRRRDPI
jgi:ABC-2 type transport system permease protein